MSSSRFSASTKASRAMTRQAGLMSRTIAAMMSTLRAPTVLSKAMAWRLMFEGATTWIGNTYLDDSGGGDSPVSLSSTGDMQPSAE